jgi:hypothetical protein
MFEEIITIVSHTYSSSGLLKILHICLFRQYNICSGDKNKNINTRRCQNLPLVFLLAENKKF